MSGRWSLSIPSRLLSALRDLPAPLVVSMCVNAYGAGLFYPFALLYYIRATSLSVGTIGWVLTIATFLTLAVSPITGSLADRFGARRLVSASQFIEAVGFVLLLTVSSAGSLLVAALLVTGATRMYYASFSTLIAEVSSGASQDRAYGLVGVTQSVAASIGGLMAAVLISGSGLTGFRSVIAGNAICLLVSGVSLSRIRQASVRPAGEPGMRDSGFRAVFGDQRFVRIVACNTLFVLCTMLPGLGAAVYMIDVLGLDPIIVGAFGIVQTVLVILLQMRVIDHVAESDRVRTMVVAGGMWAVACLGYAAAMLFRDAQPVLVPWLLAVIVIFVLAQMLYIPTARALAVAMAPAGAMGRYVATFEFSWGLAGAVGPALFGTLFDLGPALPWLAMAGLVGIATMQLRTE